MVIPKPKPAKRVKGRKPPKRKTSRQLLDTELNNLVRSIVFLRDGGCVTPAPERGHSNVRQPGHLVSRGRKGVKWDLWNVNEQCSSCNVRHSKPNGWVYYETWFVRKFGEGERLRIDEDSNAECKLSVNDMLELREQLKEIYEKQLQDKSFKPRFSQRQILSGEWRNEQGKNLFQPAGNLVATVPAISSTGTFVTQ